MLFSVPCNVQPKKAFDSSLVLHFEVFAKFVINFIAWLIAWSEYFDIVNVNFNDNLAAHINACVCFKDLKSKTYYHSTE